MIKSTRTLILPILILALCLSSVNTQKPVVLITSTKAKLDRPVLDYGTLQQHVKTGVSRYVVEVGEVGDIGKVVRDVLGDVVADKDVSSFVMDHEELRQAVAPTIQQLNLQDLTKTLLQTPQSIIYFLPKHSRLLSQTQPQQPQPQPSNKSNLLLNMTPSILSGLFVALFLLVMLMIAVSCLLNIKTNDKFASTNLFVGKES